MVVCDAYHGDPAKKINSVPVLSPLRNGGSLKRSQSNHFTELNPNVDYVYVCAEDQIVAVCDAYHGDPAKKINSVPVLSPLRNGESLKRS